MKQPPQNSFRVFSFITSFYNASRMFCSATSQFYLASLGLELKELMQLYAVHSTILALVNFPISVWADAFSRRFYVVIGLILVSLHFCIFWALTPLKAMGFWQTIGGTSSIWPFIVVAEIVYGLGREAISSALDAWVAEQLPEPHREKTFASYNHLAQRYSSVFSLLSGAIGIALSTTIGLAFPYLCSAIGLLCTIGAFYYVAFIQPSVTPQKAATNLCVPAKSTLSQTLKNASLSLKEIFGSRFGISALCSFIFVCMARWITFHFWQSTLFPEVSQDLRQLPTTLFIPLIGCHLGMYIGQFLTNAYLEKSVVFSRVYHRRSYKVLLLGVVAALFLTTRPGWSIWLAHKHTEWLLTILAFSLLQGSVTSAQVIQSNLFVRTAKQSTLTGSISLLHTPGRLITAMASMCMKKELKAQGHSLFIVPAVALFAFNANAFIWKKCTRKT